ncbi:hypothetical protein ACFSKM_20310 [Ancylobacter dichloromethanicus]
MSAAVSLAAGTAASARAPSSLGRRGGSGMAVLTFGFLARVLRLAGFSGATPSQSPSWRLTAVPASSMERFELLHRLGRQRERARHQQGEAR